MTRRALEHRLLALEQLYAKVGRCACRRGQETSYHDAGELARIMAVSCPVHGIRELGTLVRVGTALPLRKDDQQFCSCPSTPLRDFLLDLRGPLTPEEHVAVTERWRREYAPDWDEERGREQESIDRLIRSYQFKESTRRAKYAEKRV